ncbi:MAG: efflux RND transporter periplasmic adaptor subunit [Burkholderiales bacterium]|nr:efflux RND transporter periplasmic adaptor subunit [Burkholderiales bacterium]
MKMFPLQRRTLAVLAAVVPLVALLAYVALRSGPMAPVAVTEAAVESRSIRPALFGIGTVEARYTYRIGPTFAGRLKRLDVHVGDAVKAGQVLGEMDPVDLDERIRAQDAALRRAEAAIREASARHSHAELQAKRYERMLAVHATSEETLATKRQEFQVADAALAVAREEQARARADRDALAAQRGNLRLVAPVDGLVTLRDADPGTTIVAGQAVVEVIDPRSLWIDARFDQGSASGLAASLPAQIVLRSRDGELLQGRVSRVEPRADAVTEETRVKVVFDGAPSPLPPLGELAEVTVGLPALPAAPIVPNAAVHGQRGQVGVWKVEGDEPSFVPVKLGRADLDGRVQVMHGLRAGDRIVVHSERVLAPGTRVKVVDRIPGTPR